MHSSLKFFNFFICYLNKHFGRTDIPEGGERTNVSDKKVNNRKNLLVIKINLYQTNIRKFNFLHII